MILDDIVLKTEKRVLELKKSISLNELVNKANTHPKSDFCFLKKLKANKFSIIAEIKKASPSKGIIDKTFHYEKIAQSYQNADVDCISVLTEPFFFQGNDIYLKKIKEITNLPVLRKDFIIDEYQIYESIALGADCILLICAILTDELLTYFLEIANLYQITALVETHNKKEINRAIKAGAKLIGVNNRDLKTFTVDINNSIRLREFVPKDVLFVSESGIKTKEDIQKLKRHNVDAVLIGETFMKSKNKEKLIHDFKKA